MKVQLKHFILNKHFWKNLPEHSLLTGFRRMDNKTDGLQIKWTDAQREKRFRVLNERQRGRDKWKSAL